MNRGRLKYLQRQFFFINFVAQLLSSNIRPFWLFPRLSHQSQEQEDNASVVWSGIQVALNDVAQSITGTRRRDHVRPRERNQDGGQGHCGRDVGLFSQRQREGRLQKPRRQAPLLGQEDSHRKDHTVGKDRADRGPSKGGRHLHCPHGQCVEQVSLATRRADEGGSEEGGIRLGESFPALIEILQDLTSRLRLLGCSLRVVGRLLRDVGCIPWNVGGVLHEVGHQTRLLLRVEPYFFLHLERPGLRE
jgi:hypothetical protein